jgi:Histidine kinase-, DNA gyrase B-, and HSP90-like ATPase
MQLDGSSLTSQGAYGLRLLAMLGKFRAWFQKPWKRQLATNVLPANIAAATHLGRVFELLERILDLGGKALGTRFSANYDSEGGEQADTPPLPQEVKLDQQIYFRVVLLGPIQPLNPAIRDDVYRIGREALENAFHHSQASRIEVEFEYAADRFRMVVRDNGRGIDPQVFGPRQDDHWGLPDIAELARKIGATFTVWSSTSSGTELELSIPNHIALEA